MVDMFLQRGIDASYDIVPLWPTLSSHALASTNDEVHAVEAAHFTAQLREGALQEVCILAAVHPSLTVVYSHQSYEVQLRP